MSGTSQKLVAQRFGFSEPPTGQALTRSDITLYFGNARRRPSLDGLHDL